MLKRLILLAPLLVQAVLAAPGLETRHRHLHDEVHHGHGNRNTPTTTAESADQTIDARWVKAKLGWVKAPNKSQRPNNNNKDNSDGTVPEFIAPKQPWVKVPNKSSKPSKPQVGDSVGSKDSTVPEFIPPKFFQVAKKKPQDSDQDSGDQPAATADSDEVKVEEKVPEFIQPKGPYRGPQKSNPPSSDTPEESTVPEFIPPRSPFGYKKPRAVDEETDIIDDDFDYSDEDFPGVDTAESPAPEDDSSEEEQANDNTTILETRGVRRRNILYFTNWGIYRANFQPQNIPASEITHVLYSFLDIAQDGTVKSIDTWADTDKHYPGDSWNEAGNNVYGCVKQLYILKKKYRNMKVLMSLGGWTLSPHFVQPASTLAGRRKIAASAVKLLGDWGFDGIDVDWEYPQNAQQAQNYVDLLKEIRLALDKFSRDNKLNYRFLLTVATAAGPANYNIMKLKAMDQYLDGWHLMAYDYAGGWDTTTGHQANVYLSSSNPLSTKFSTDRAINDYVRAGVAPQKILMGIPLYGRSFANTAGLGQSYNGLGGGSNENGIYLFKDLPRPGAKAAIDKNLMTIITYDKQKRELVTTDSADSARLKAAYITRRGLGGAFYWEASGDKLGAKSVVSAVRKSMGPLEVSQNLLRYPTSVYDNIRRGMP
ncbi:Chitinase 4 [Fusarium falciforme]|uniref:chitinase n=1 Tax=Fusarium falciforme TaxID=195108 RepID=A0A9W8RGQ3_9HYPO|nr:Chitinase 4 [Fusarium falciforme]KAJ4207731.1 Chitinase 4 [Fusarium falciforme]KAJ4259062.1 Chitinase 4 [Fusarium falciforme]